MGVSVTADEAEGGAPRSAAVEELRSQIYKSLKDTSDQEKVTSTSSPAASAPANFKVKPSAPPKS
jgi:hypothetical protein